MAEKRKFSALAGIRQQSVEQIQESQPSTGTRGRPTGKRSNPDFQPTTVLLRKATKRAATRKLEDDNVDQDLSELIEQLLTRWISQKV
jgi:hypothetical protein